ncbi:nucleoside kinase [Pelomyxa schiedti]|nr:nucleoside kinase [Pelomyxa schiedti]
MTTEQGSGDRLDLSKCVVTFPSGRKVTYPNHTPLLGVSQDAEMKSGDRVVVAASVEGLLMSLSETIPFHLASVVPVFWDSSEGHACLSRTLVFVLQMAVFKEFHESFLLTVEHSLGSGFMCLMDHGTTVATPEIITRLSKCMASLVEQDIPITITKLSHAESELYMSGRNRPYSLAMIRASNQFTAKYSCCGDFLEVYRRPLGPSTGILKRFTFELLQYDVGFVLRFPDTTNPGILPTFTPDPRIVQVFKEGHSWGKVLSVACIGQLNQKVVAGDVKQYLALNEAVHNHKIVELSLTISQRVAKGVKLILIAGPSASGKTTFAAKLALQLEILGITPTIVSVDNYYKPHSEVPRDSSGNLDFEVLEALRIDTLNEHLLQLFSGEETQTPIFDFHTGKPKAATIPLTLQPGGVIIMEGIHCLNDCLTPRVPLESKFKIFLAPFTQMNLDESNFIPNSTGRLIRRIVRDYNHRGYSATDTLNRWASVRRGEDLSIFPFMKDADVVFNSALDYEVAVLKTFCKPLLKSVKSGTPPYNNAQELLEFLSFAFVVPHDNVPPDSLLREFIGGSFFQV